MYVTIFIVVLIFLLSFVFSNNISEHSLCYYQYAPIKYSLIFSYFFQNYPVYSCIYTRTLSHSHSLSLSLYPPILSSLSFIFSLSFISFSSFPFLFLSWSYSGTENLFNFRSLHEYGVKDEPRIKAKYWLGGLLWFGIEKGKGFLKSTLTITLNMHVWSMQMVFALISFPPRVTMTHLQCIRRGI